MSIVVLACALAGVLALIRVLEHRSQELAAGYRDSLRPSPVSDYVLYAARLPAHNLTAQQASSLISMPWKLIQLEPNGRVLRVYFAAGDGWCAVYRGLHVHETATDVTVAVLAANPHPSSQACPSNLQVGRTAIRLSQPLGSRALMHASVAGDWDDPNLLH